MKLTFEEYQNLNGSCDDEKEFGKLLQKSIVVLSVYTRHFYRTNDFDSDVEWRKEAVKTALAFQIDYFHELGTTNYEGLNSTPQMMSIGRTTIGQASRMTTQGKMESKPMLCFDSQMALQGTGLLYRGVKS